MSHLQTINGKEGAVEGDGVGWYQCVGLGDLEWATTVGPSGLAGLVFICWVWLCTGSAYWQSGNAEAALLGAGWAVVNL